MSRRMLVEHFYKADAYTDAESNADTYADVDVNSFVESSRRIFLQMMMIDYDHAIDIN